MAINNTGVTHQTNDPRIFSDEKVVSTLRDPKFIESDHLSDFFVINFLNPTADLRTLKNVNHFIDKKGKVWIELDYMPGSWFEITQQLNDYLDQEKVIQDLDAIRSLPIEVLQDRLKSFGLRTQGRRSLLAERLIRHINFRNI